MKSNDEFNKKPDYSEARKLIIIMFAIIAMISVLMIKLVTISYDNNLIPFIIIIIYFIIGFILIYCYIKKRSSVILKDYENNIYNVQSITRSELENKLKNINFIVTINKKWSYGIRIENTKNLSGNKTNIDIVIISDGSRILEKESMEINHTIDELIKSKKVNLSKLVTKYLLINIDSDDELYLEQCKKEPRSTSDIIIAYMTRDSALYYCKNIENFYGKMCGADTYRIINVIHELFK